MINKDVNVRTSLTLPKDLKYKLEVLAKNEKRSHFRCQWASQIWHAR